MGLASSKNKNVISFLLLWIYMFLLEPEICCAVQGSSMEKHIIRLTLRYKYSNKILIRPGSSARCAPVDPGCVERGWSQAVLLLSDALPVPRVAAACAVIPIPPNPWSWRLAVPVEQCHCCHSAQFTRLKWAIWCVSPSSVVCWSGRMDWMFSAELWWKTKKYKTFAVVSASLIYSPLSLNIMDRKIIYFSSEILYVLFGFFNLVSFFKSISYKMYSHFSFFYLHFLSLFHVACNYWQVFPV